MFAKVLTVGLTSAFVAIWQCASHGRRVMLKVSTYEGSMEDLVQFVNRIWDHSYLGKMTYPRWTVDFFNWQLGPHLQPSRQNLIAAYDGGTLAGVLLGTSYPYRTPVGRHVGSLWSWLSIDPAYRGQRIAKRLDQERIDRQREHNSRLIVSYRYFGSRHSQAEKPRADSPDLKFNRRIGFWARVLDPSRFAKWHFHRFEGQLARLSAPLLKVPQPSGNPATRPYLDSDLDSCLTLVQQCHAGLVLTIDWDRESLRQQLGGSGPTRTIVAEDQGQIVGLVNFHVLDFHARCIEPVAIIDLLLIHKMSSVGRTALLNAALAAMKCQGAVLALKLRCGDVPVWPLLRTHFIPQPADSHLVLQPVSDAFSIDTKANIHLLWR